VLHLDADLVHPRHARRGVGHRLELVGAVVPHAGWAIGIEHDLHRRRDESFDRHPSFARDIAEEVVRHEVGEHLARVHAEPRVGVRKLLGELRLQRRELVEPVRCGFEMRVDVDDRRDAHFIIPPETDRSSPVTNEDASLTR
jgi:hypothetical protein